LRVVTPSTPARLDRQEGRHELAGFLLGFLGVLVFSLTLPMTRLAVLELPAGFVAFGRIALAALAGAATLFVVRPRRPSAREWLEILPLPHDPRPP
jgi:hypothetical protein